MKRWKVWGIQPNGTDRFVVAARTQLEAANALGISLYQLREFGSETGNQSEIELAMQTPGKAVNVSKTAKAVSA